MQRKDVEIVKKKKRVAKVLMLILKLIWKLINFSVIRKIFKKNDRDVL